MSDATREHVREVADSMGYRPNVAARRLAGGRVGLISVAFSMAGELPVALTEVDYFSQAIGAATTRALERDYALVVAPPRSDATLWSRVPLDGVVVFDPAAGDSLLTELRSSNVPLVLSGRDPAGGDDYRVDNDHLAGTRTVLDHLAGQNANRIALLVGDLSDSFTADCLAAYRDWCEEHAHEPLITTVPFGRFAEVEVVDGIFATEPRPDAVYATVEVLGRSVIEAAARRGMRVPGDLLVAAAGDREPPGMRVPLTVLELDPARLAAEAVDVLIELIENRPPSKRERLVPTRLVERDSTAYLDSGIS